MKSAIIKILSLLAVPAIVVGAAACKDDGAANSGYELLDKDAYPAVEAPYEEESRAAIERWLAAENNPLTSAQVAKEVAAELFAYACYNEEYIDKYVYFSDQTGSTDLGATGKSTVTKQDYKLIIHESDKTPGYKYHYTIKHVDEISGVISMFQSLFESGTRLRFVTDTNKLYRFDGNDPHYAEDESLVQDILTCNWTPDTSSWGTDDPPIVKREGEKLTLAEMEQDVLETARSGGESAMHCNINILADGIVDSASIMKMPSGDCYTVTMNINIDVANADEASITMLRNANGSSDCRWVSEGGSTSSALQILYQVWDNGLFKVYGLKETWSGTTNGFRGTANSSLSVQYSYSDRDTDMTAKLAMLDEAIASRG